MTQPTIPNSQQPITLGGQKTDPTWYRWFQTVSAYIINIVLPLAANQGGTGHTGPYTNGQLLIGDSSTGALDVSTLTAGPGVSITNGQGAITIGFSGGVGVMTVNAGYGMGGGGSTPTVTLNSFSASTMGSI